MKGLEKGDAPAQQSPGLGSVFKKFVTSSKKELGAEAEQTAAPAKETADAEVQTEPVNVVAGTAESRHSLEVSNIFGSSESDIKKDKHKKHPSRFWANLIANNDAAPGVLGAQQAADEAATIFDGLVATWRASAEHERQAFTPLKRVRAIYLSKYGTNRAAERHLLNFMVQSNSLPRPPFKCDALAKMCEYANPELLYSADTMCVIFATLAHVRICNEKPDKYRPRHVSSTHMSFDHACRFLIHTLQLVGSTAETVLLWERLESAATVHGGREEGQFSDTERRRKLVKYLVYERMNARSFRPIDAILQKVGVNSDIPGIITISELAAFFQLIGITATRGTLEVFTTVHPTTNEKVVSVAMLRDCLEDPGNIPYCSVDEDVLLECVLKAWDPTNAHINLMLQEMFLMFDTSGDGYLSCDEFTELVKAVEPATVQDRALEMFDSAADYGTEEFETLGISESLFARVYRRWNSENSSTWMYDPETVIVHKRIALVDDLSDIYDEPEPEVEGLTLEKRLTDLLTEYKLKEEQEKQFQAADNSMATLEEVRQILVD
jgi:hypothetical protein